jgi:hypothetical protein
MSLIACHKIPSLWNSKCRNSEFFVFFLIPVCVCGGGGGGGIHGIPRHNAICVDVLYKCIPKCYCIVSPNSEDVVVVLSKIEEVMAMVGQDGVDFMICIV